MVSPMKLGMLLCVLGLIVAGLPAVLGNARRPFDGREAAEQMTVASATTATVGELPTTLVTIHLRNGGSVRIRVTIADTPARQSLGLAGRKQLDSDVGMLFVFPDPGRYEFWMRDVTIPLSIAFIAPDDIIVDIRNLNPLDDRRQVPPVDVNAAVEVPRGLFTAKNVGVGDRVDMPPLRIDRSR